jgi:hypothetical protein
VTVRGGGRNRATAAQLTGEEGAGPVGQRAAPRCGGGLRPAHEKGRAMRRVFHDGCDDGKTEDRGGSLTYERRWRRQGRTRGTFPSFKEARLGSKMGWSGGTWSTGVVGTEVVANGTNGRTALEARKRRSGVASV